MSEKQRLIRMLKDNETTSKSDYLAEKLRPIVKTEWRPKTACQRVRPAPLKDTHSMTDWKVPRVPFNLYWKEESDVDGANPHVPQKPYLKPVDYEREHIRTTRPHIVMTPAISFDAIKEPARQAVLDDVYISATELMLRQPYKLMDAKCHTLRVKAPLPAMYAPPKPIAIRKLNSPYVSPEWRMESVSWDGSADRTHVAPTREFWLRRGRQNAKIGRRLQPSKS